MGELKIFGFKEHVRINYLTTYSIVTMQVSTLLFEVSLHTEHRHRVPTYTESPQWVPTPSPGAACPHRIPPHTCQSMLTHACWHILTHVDTHMSYILTHDETCWNILTQIDMCVDTSWHMHPDTYWHILTHPDTFWHILTHTDNVQTKLFQVMTRVTVGNLKYILSLL